MRRSGPPGPMRRVSTLKAGSSGRYIRMTPATNAMPWQYDTCQHHRPSSDTQHTQFVSPISLLCMQRPLCV